MTAYDADAFDAYEASGWEAVAAKYDEHWSSITSRVIDPLLDAARVERGARVVDVGTGSGDAAGCAADRGAIATGVDVAAAMVEIAAQRHPAAQFIQASATRLPFADGSFDAAVGNIVIQHIGEPDRAALELRASARLGRSPRAVDVGCPETLAILRDDPRSRRRRECSSAHGHPDGPVVLSVRGRRGVRSSIAGRWFRRCSHRRDLVRGAARLGGGAGRGPRRGDSAHGCAAASGRRWVLSSASRWRRGWSRGDTRRRMRSRRRSRSQADASRHERVYERQPKRGCAETRGRTSLSLQSDRVPVAGGNQ